MRPPYYVIKECLKLLESRVPTGMKKVQTEILLLQTLRVALMNVEYFPSAAYCSEESTKALLHELQEICNSSENDELAIQFYDRVREFALPIRPLVSGQPPEPTAVP